MAQAGYTPILIYASGTATNIPTAGNLISGSSGAELAINYADGKLYYKDGSGNVKLLSIGYGSSSVTPTNGGVQYGTGTALALTAAGSSGQILRSNGAAAPTWADLSTLGVNTISFGTTGLTPNSATAGAVTVAGTLVTANGGTGLGGATPFTANGVLYASSASALTSGSALTFDGTNLGIGAAATANYGNLQVTGSAQSSLFAQLGTDTVRMGVRATGRTGIVFDSANATYTNRMWYIDNIGSVGSLIIGRSGLDVLTFDNSGNLGLGVTPSAWGFRTALQIGSGGSLAAFNGGASFASNIEISGNSFLNASASRRYIANDFATLYRQEGGIHSWLTAPSGTAGNAITFTQAMTLDASGNLIVPYRAVFGQTVSGDSVLQVASAYGGLRIGYNSTNVNYFDGDTQIFRNSAGTTERARITSGGDFYIGTTTNYGRLTVQTDGTNGSVGFVRNTDNAFPATLDFIKSRGSAGSPTAVQSGDDLLLVRTAPYQGSAYTYLNAMAVQVDGTYTSGQNPPTRIIFNTNAANGSSTERARITSGGDLLVGVTNFTDAGGGVAVASGAASENVRSSATSTGAWGHYGLYNSNGRVGLISTNGTATTYATSSDYRLKDNPQPLTNSGAFIDALQPKTWSWKADGSKGVGFIAHEVQEVSPGSVVGEKDGEQMQAMEYGSAEFIANIIAELQSLRQRVALLEGN